MFTTLLSFFTFGLYGQSLRSEGEFYGGIKAGINLSKITSMKFIKRPATESTKEEADYGKFGYGFQLGYFQGYHFSDDLALQVELLYNITNSKTAKMGADDKTYLEKKFRNQSIDLPVLVKYYPAESLYIAAGPKFGFAIYMQEKESNFVNGSEVNGDIAKYENINRNGRIGKIFNFAGVIGIGYDFTENFSLEGRYTYGFAPSVYDADKINIAFSSINNFEIGKNNNYSIWQLGLAYTF